MGFFVGGGWVGRNVSIIEIFHTKFFKKCQGFVQDFELGEGGTFMYLLREGGWGRNFLKNSYSEIDSDAFWRYL